MISTIELSKKVIEKGLCANCGACQGLCPYWSEAEGRTLSYFDCDRSDGRCLKFCPRMPLDMEALRDQFFDKEDVIPQIGPFKALYLTRAADPAIREHSQHGGSMTALIQLAMEEGFIDAAVMTKADNTLEAHGVLATSVDEIRACSGSSFQIPAALAVLNKALKEDKYKKIGVVGTPCKTTAVYKMKAQPFAENTNNADNIGFVFGLFCGWGLDWHGLADLVDRHTDPETTRHMDILPSKYHCMDIKDANGVTRVDLDEVLPLVRQTCKYCADMTCEFSDLSVGGARSADGWDVDQGWNQVIVRSEKGMKLMELAKEKGILEFKEVPEGAVNKLKAASRGKKRTAVKNLTALTGSAEDYAYLNPSKALIDAIIAE